MCASFLHTRRLGLNSLTIVLIQWICLQLHCLQSNRLSLFHWFANFSKGPPTILIRLVIHFTNAIGIYFQLTCNTRLWWSWQMLNNPSFRTFFFSDSCRHSTRVFHILWCFVKLMDRYRVRKWAWQHHISHDNGKFHNKTLRKENILNFPFIHLFGFNVYLNRPTYNLQHLVSQSISN